MPRKFSTKNIASVIRKAVMQAALVSSVFLFLSCWFFPAENKYYKIKYAVGDAQEWVDYSDSAIDADNTIYLMKTDDNDIDKWTVENGVESYLHIEEVSSLGSIEIDEAADVMYVKAYENNMGYIWEVDLSSGTPEEVFTGPFISGDALAIAGDYIVVEDEVSGHLLIRRSDFTIADTVTTYNGGEEYIFIPGKNLLMITGSSSFDTVAVDQASGAFGTVVNYDSSGLEVNLPVITSPDGSMLIMGDGSVLEVSDTGISKTGSIDGFRAGCFFHNSIITADPSDSSLIHVYAVTSPYNEVKPAIDLGEEVDCLDFFPGENELYMISGEGWDYNSWNYSMNYSTMSIYCFDTSICE